MISRRRRSMNSSGKCAIYFSSVKATRSCNGWPFLRWALLSFPELPPFRLSSSSSASSVRSSSFLYCFESWSGGTRKFSPRSDPDWPFRQDYCWKFFFKRVQFVFDYPDHTVLFPYKIFKMFLKCLAAVSLWKLANYLVDLLYMEGSESRSGLNPQYCFFAKCACM